MEILSWSTPLQLYRRLQVKENLESLPVAVASTVYNSLYERIFQGVYRSANDDGEGCIEIRSMNLSSQDKWNVWESVTEEDGVFGGVCWSLLHKGYILVATASRVYFFLTTPEKRRNEENYWTQGKRCLIFEVDIFLQWVLPDGNWKYATRIFGAKDGNITILVFVSQKTQLESFRLDVCPNTLQVTIGARTGTVTWKSGARGALIAWSMGRKLMTAHCCEDECSNHGNGQTSVFKTWFARGEKRSLKELVWEYGGIIIDCWDT